MTSKRIQRSASAEGNLVTVDKAQFVTLVKKPANQRSFGILRSDREDGNVSKPVAATRRVSRTKRSDSNQDLVSLTLPGTLDEAAAKDALVSYGLSNFTVARSADDSAWVASNPSAINCTAELTSVNLGEGLVAQVKRTEATASTEGKGQLTVTSLEFSGEAFADAGAVSEWCQRNSVDFDDKALNNPSGNLVLQRAEIPEGEETRLMELEDGVTATIIRSQIGDIPDGFVAVINEYAYCGWGWGQLDFTAALMGRQVTDALYDGIWILEDLLRNILFWSELTVDIRMELTTRACAQFANYANGLLDSLPRQLLISVATTQRSSKENDMSTTKQPAVEAQRTEPAVAPAVVAVGSPEFNTAVADAVAAEIKRREDAQAEQEAEEVKRKEQEELDKASLEEQAKIRRSELEEVVGAATKPLLEQIEALKGTTVVRSQGGDPEANKENVKRGTGDLFKGVFGITRADRRVDAAAAADADEAAATK